MTPPLVPAWTVAHGEHSAPGWVYVLDADSELDWQGLHGSALIAALTPVRVVGEECGFSLVRRTFNEAAAWPT